MGQFSAEKPVAPGSALSGNQQFRYEGYDIITLQKLIEREYQIPEPQTAEEVIGYYARRIAQDVKLPSQFAVLAPKVREFLETKAFGERVTLDEPAMIKAIGDRLIEKLASLPPVPGALDQIVQRFGTDLLAEVTGRSRRVIRKCLPSGGDRLVVENRAGSANLAETGRARCESQRPTDARQRACDRHRCPW
jgi:hypothetical protein